MADIMDAYNVALRNNATGEIRLIAHPSPWGKDSDYLWTEGNYSCDCNRHLLFERDKGFEPDAADVKCGDVKYSALYATLSDGTHIDLDGDK